MVSAPTRNTLASRVSPRFFPTILIVLLAVFNDGAMIALAKDRVTPSQLPSMWRIRNIFIMGVGYGIYLTGTTILLYCLAAMTQFFTNFQLPSINTSNSVVTSFCTDLYVCCGLDTHADVIVVGSSMLPDDGTFDNRW